MNKLMQAEPSWKGVDVFTSVSNAGEDVSAPAFETPVNLSTPFKTGRSPSRPNLVHKQGKRPPWRSKALIMLCQRCTMGKQTVTVVQIVMQAEPSWREVRSVLKWAHP